MVLSRTVEYALRAMLHLTRHPGQAVSGRSIARAVGAPPDYLAKVMRLLVAAGLVQAYRGPHGGFILARDPGAISILDVVEAVDPLPRIRRCPLGRVGHARLCPLHRRLDEALAAMARSFGETTLAQLLSPGGWVRCCPALLAERTGQERLGGM